MHAAIHLLMVSLSSLYIDIFASTSFWPHQSNFVLIRAALQLHRSSWYLNLCVGGGVKGCLVLLIC